MDYIFFTKSILSLDDFFPLAVELKKAGMASQPLFIAPNRQTYEYLRKNIVLYEGIKSIGGKLTCLYRYKNRYMNQIYNIIVLRKYIYKKVISIELYFPGKLVSLLISYNRRLLKGKRVRSLLFNRPFEQSINCFEYIRIVKGEPEKNEVEEKVITGYDYVLLSQTKEQYEEIHKLKLIVDCPIIRVGYTRGLPEWQRFLDKNESRYLSGEIEKPFVFFSLNRTNRWLLGEDSTPSDELLKECLLVLKKFNNDIMTVFKPHNNTDMDKVVAIIESTGYKNYIISYLHPWLLIKNAKFTFSYTPSGISVDAHFLGCTTVEYAHYDSRFYKYIKGQSMYLDSVDFFVHKDTRQLEKVLKELIYNDSKVQREPNKLSDDFPVLSQDEIKETFCNM